ncbi:MAG: hypothetical protein AAF789_07385 [Bacteroidota bacterium]
MRYVIVLAASFFLLSGTVFSQGCSDAGFCTMGAMKPDQNFNRQLNLKLRTISFQYYRGKSTASVVVDSWTMEAVIGLNDLSSVQIKVPYQMTEGRLGSNQGIGDISLSYTRSLKRTLKYEINATIGGKIPTNNSQAKSEGGLTLPMYYQTSLGSYDIVSGISFLTSKWLVAFGYQKALTRTENDFTFGEWVRFPDKAYLASYDVGIGHRRGDDIMLRVERNFRFVNSSFNVGLLPIYRITPDSGILRARGDGASLQTTGLALSALSGFTYFFDTRNNIKLVYGRKITARLANPDGLTRNWVFNFIYEFRF